MIEIKDLLLHFKSSLLYEGLKKDSVRRIISEAIKVEIKQEDIEIKNSVIKLNIKPIYKNEIFLKRDLILEKLQQELGKKSPTELR
ncbi:MAG: hypothetical protein NTZ44_01255 [Candidatus Nomurabacteria bacterium]|nr:hypothetical protein [Candidatus Nomurabacteria bacterium]